MEIIKMIVWIIWGIVGLISIGLSVFSLVLWKSWMTPMKAGFMESEEEEVE